MVHIHCFLNENGIEVKEMTYIEDTSHSPVAQKF